MKRVNAISLFLGVTIFSFGILKLINPFREWVTIQITKSGMPSWAFPVAIIGEITTGIFFLLPFIFSNSLSRFKPLFFVTGNVILLMMMVVAVYVHLQPAVPADVLPLKIKGPYIPAAYILIGGINLFLIVKNLKNGKNDR